jgi:hypothetical protein
MISWKLSFKRLNEEYDLAKRKKQALDNLFETGRISRSTYDSFSGEIAAALADIEKQQKALIEKMQLKAQELNSQIKTLEMLLANFEIQHVAGEVDEEVYQREISLLTIGLENAKKELEVINDAVNQLVAPASTVVEAPPQPEQGPVVSEPASETPIEQNKAPCADETAAPVEQAPVETQPTEQTAQQQPPSDAVEITQTEDVQASSAEAASEAASEAPTEAPVEQVAETSDNKVEEAVQVQQEAVENPQETTADSPPEAKEESAPEEIADTQPEQIASEGETATEEAVTPEAADYA